MSEPRRWQVWRERSGHYVAPTLTSTSLKIGECVHVVEAAPVEAELERLRAENNGLYEQIAAAGEDVGEMEAELDRLRRIEAAARLALDLAVTGVDDCPYAAQVAHIPRAAIDALRNALGEPSDA